MKWLRRKSVDSQAKTGAEPSIAVVIPAYGVEAYLRQCLDSLLAQTHRTFHAVVVDDGSPDRSGEIAEEYAARDPRIAVLHQENAGLGAARNAGVAHLARTHPQTDYLAFLDSDDVLPPTAYAAMVAAAEASGSDLVSASLLRWEPEPPLGAGLHEPRWLHRLHNPPRTGIRIEDHPELLGDVFAHNKLFRRSWWNAQGLSWPQGVRYEDQPTSTTAFLAARFDVISDPVIHWRIRTDGSSISQQRASLEDLSDRWLTKRMSWESVLAHGDDRVTAIFHDRVLAGDLHRYFVTIPGADDEWWQLLVSGVREFWGERSLVHSGLPPVHRLCGYLVEQDRREDAVRLMSFMAERKAPAPRNAAGTALELPTEVLAPGSVPPEALALRDFERSGV